MEVQPAGYNYSRDRGIPEVELRIRLLRGRLASRPREKDSRLLEVGVGSGETAIMAAELFTEVTCVDPEERNLRPVEERLRQLGISTVTFIQGRIEEARLAQEGYDAILLQNILEHLENPVQVLLRLAAFLRPRGLMHICVPLANSLHRALGLEMGLISHLEELAASDRAYGHFRVYTASLLRRQVRSAGLRIHYEQPFYLKPLPTGFLTPLPAEVHQALFSLGQKFPEWASYLYLEAGV